MGTVLNDFLNPEFVLLGVDKAKDLTPVRELYKTMHDRPLFETDITTAEGIKVFYNTFITMKTVLANIYGEMSHKLGMNVDDIYEALSLATDRIISNKYLKSGVGDGGGCHPRDNIALSHIAKEVSLSHNIFEDLMAAREDHMEWLADYAIELMRFNSLQIIVLGKSFKPETDIETGSPAVLLVNILKEKKAPVTHLTGVPNNEIMVPVICVIGTQKPEFKETKFAPGSIVLDPFRYIPDQDGVKVIRIGE